MISCQDNTCAESHRPTWRARLARRLPSASGGGPGGTAFPQKGEGSRGNHGFLRVLELNGALSNPRVAVDLVRLGALHDELLAKALVNPREPRSTPAKVSPVLETVTLVLDSAEEPMRGREIHATAEKLVSEPLCWTSVKAALVTEKAGKSPRFRRVRRGVYQTAENASARRTPLLKSR